jgi:acyl-ACP thioesterase
MGVTLSVTTRVVGYQRVWAQRRAECRLPDGTPAARVRTDWVMIDGRGRLARVPAEIGERFPAPLLDEPILRVALPPAPEDAWRRRFRVRPHELDPMNHPNNAVYVDWIDESLLLAGIAVEPGAREIALEYAAAAAPGAEIAAAGWPTEGGLAVRLTGPDGTDLLRASLRR